jgi:3-hydroxyisobutyrate dehydrogenase
VSGGVAGAAAGSLAIMVGGDAADLEEARPALAAMGANIIHVGAVGAGEVAKLCNNLISGSALIAVAEAFRIGEAYGVDPRVLTEVIAKSSGATWVMAHMHPVPGIVEGAASSRQYAPGFMTDLMAKDLDLATAYGATQGVPLTLTATARQALTASSTAGYGREDFSAVAKVIASLSGLAEEESV